MDSVSLGFTLREAMVLDASVKSSKEYLEHNKAKMISDIGAKAYKELMASHTSIIAKISYLVADAMTEQKEKNRDDAA